MNRGETSVTFFLNRPATTATHTKLNPLSLHDALPIFISELCALEIKGTTISHPVNGHDDTVFAFMMCLMVYHYGKGLEKYGYYRGVGPTGKPPGIDTSLYYDSQATNELLEQHGFVQNNKLASSFDNEYEAKIQQLMKQGYTSSWESSSVENRYNANIKIEDSFSDFVHIDESDSVYTPAFGASFYDDLNE